MSCHDCAGISHCFRPTKPCVLKEKLERDFATLERIRLKRDREERAMLDFELIEARRKVFDKTKS